MRSTIRTAIDGLICESFAFKVYAPDIALKLLEGASHIVPHVHVLQLKLEDFTRDPQWLRRAERRSADRGRGRSRSRRVAALAARRRTAASAEFGRITLPVADPARHRRQGDQAARAASSSSTLPARADKELKLYDGYAHDLLNDLGREQVMDDIDRLDRSAAAQPVDAEMPVAT